jgi:hypothetical protein
MPNGMSLSHCHGSGSGVALGIYSRIAVEISISTLCLLASWRSGKAIHSVSVTLMGEPRAIIETGNPRSRIEQHQIHSGIATANELLELLLVLPTLGRTS